MGSTWATGGGGGTTWATGGGGGGGGGGTSASDLLDEHQLQKALDAAKAKKHHGHGLFGRLSNLGGQVLHTLGGGVAQGLHDLDKGRAAVIATGHQLGLGARELAGKSGPGDEKASFHNWLDEINHNIGAGQIVQQALPHANPWVKRGLGLGLDIAADPLNVVAPGRDAVANAGLRAAGAEIGDAAARQALREGGLDALRQAVESHGGGALEDILGRGTTEGLGKKGTEEVVQSRLAALEKQGRGGLRIGIPGHTLSTGIGQATADKALTAIHESPVLGSLRKVFQPSARILEATGSKAAAEGFQTALHERGIAMRQASAALGEAASTPEGKKAIEAAGRKALTDTLMETAPELVSHTSENGFIPLVGKGTERTGQLNLLGGAENAPVYVHPSVKESLQALVPEKAQTDLGKAGQAVMDKIKQYTVFGPQNAIQHDSKRITFNTLRAITSGGEGVKDFMEARKAYRAITAAVKEGLDPTAEELVARGLTEQEAKRAAAIAPHVLGDNPMYELSDEVRSGAKKGALGTRTAAHIAEINGDINRLGVALHHLDQGASPLEAARQARAALLDFSNEGLTQAEKKIEKGVFFYKFPRRAIPAAVQFAAEHPGEASVLTRTGLGIGTGPRNEFGQVTHLMPDTPLEAGFHDINEALTNPVGYATDNANPFIAAAAKALSGKDVKTSDVLPPVQQLQSLNKRILNNEGGPLQGLKEYSPKLAGINPGQDYVAEKAAKKESAAEVKAQAQAKDRKAAGLKPTKKDRLTKLAKKYHVPNPYSTSEAKILEAAAEKGATAKELLKALKG